MKQFIMQSVVAVIGFVCFVSCSEQESPFSADPSSTHQLRIVTRSGESEDPLASVYLFNSSSALVRSLQTDADGGYTTASASVKLPEGSYTLCALGPGDLSDFLIPDNPTLTSAIAPVSVSAMSDLLMATATASLSDGDDETVNMTLERKVLELSSVTINLVPADVTGVTVSVASFCSAVQFNGTYVESDPVTATFTLTETNTAGVWQCTTPQLVFPSIGTPVITVTFTRGEGDASTYSITELPSALTANNKYDISGNYTEPLGVTLSGTITAQPWPTTSTNVPFEFNNDNATSNTDPGSGGSSTSNPTDAPIAGQQYKGCFVVSVDESNSTAVLLSPDESDGYEVTNNGVVDNNPTAWLNCLNEDLQSRSTIEGATGFWRVPTIEEIRIFAQPAGLVSELEIASSKKYFCLVNSVLNSVEVKKGSEGASVKTPTDSYSSKTILRPVIDIAY